MLLGVLGHAGLSLSALVYYVLTYGLAALGAFGVISVVQEQTGDSNLSNFAGLSRRAPVLALAMMVFILSLAGIPPLAGFFGKFYVFAAVLRAASTNLGLLWLVVLALAMSAVSLYYYLQVLKQIYVAEYLPPSAPIPILNQVVLAVIAAGVLVMGCVPNLLVGPLTTAIKHAGL
jgi:NADH-quinone oxidoreductase subunit N